jgi:hypothetical protein
VTRIAAGEATGHFASHSPHPMQRPGSSRGRPTRTTAPSARIASTGSSQIAFGLVGQTSSHTTHGVAIAQGRQRPQSKKAVPILTFVPLPAPRVHPFVSGESRAIAPVGQTSPQRVQLGSHQPRRGTSTGV